MRDFEGKVALITGAANGFGVEIAKECALRKIKMVLVDIEGEEVELTKKLIEDMGGSAVAVQADVSKYDEVKHMVDVTMETYGRIDLLFNNAGVAVPGVVWELPMRDWEWIVSLNVMSHVCAMKNVIPIMLKQGTPCHIINTASVAGMITSDGMPAYHTTKHAAVALAESVSYDLQKINANIKISVFCPGFVQTDLHHSERHRPDRFRDDTDPYYTSDEYKAGQATAEYVIKTGMPIDSIGMSIFNAIEDDEFYILTHPIYTTLIGKRVKDMLEGKGPDLKALRG